MFRTRRIDRFGVECRYNREPVQPLGAPQHRRHPPARARCQDRIASYSTAFPPPFSTAFPPPFSTLTPHPDPAPASAPPPPPAVRARNLDPPLVPVAHPKRAQEARHAAAIPLHAPPTCRPPARRPRRPPPASPAIPQLGRAGGASRVVNEGGTARQPSEPSWPPLAVTVRAAKLLSRQVREPSSHLESFPALGLSAQPSQARTPARLRAPRADALESTRRRAPTALEPGRPSRAHATGERRRRPRRNHARRNVPLPFTTAQRRRRSRTPRAPRAPGTHPGSSYAR